MAIFKQDMNELLMSAGGLYVLDPLFATCKGGELILMWQDAEASSDYFYDSNFLDMETRDEARFFVMADYLTFIPYGSRGYAAFERMLKEVNPDISVGQFRFERLNELMDGKLGELNDGQLGYVKYYFENYNKQTVNPKIPAEVVSLICRYHHECEANFGKRGFINMMDISKHTGDFSRRLSMLYEDGGDIDCGKFLSEIAPCGGLGEEELEYIRKFTGLRSE